MISLFKLDKLFIVSHKFENSLRGASLNRARTCKRGFTVANSTNIQTR